MAVFLSAIKYLPTTVYQAHNLFVQSEYCKSRLSAHEFLTCRYGCRGVAACEH